MSHYRCVDAQKAAGFAVAAACKAAGVTRSAYYAWTATTARGPSDRHREEVRLVAEIRRIHARSKATYGAPRVHAELRRRGWAANHKRVERLMRAHGVVGYRPRRRRGLTKQDTTAAPALDLLGRLFDPQRPDVAWCGDVTYIPTDEGWLYLASVIDLASRHLLGYSMGTHHDAQLVCDTLQAAVATRGQHRMPETIFHTDRGAEGGFNWSSQHPEHWGCGWDDHGVGLRRRQEGRRCGRLAGRRWRGVSIGCGSGRRSRMGCPVRTPLWCVACRRRWGPGGSAKVAACHRSAWPRRRVATCRSPSARRSPCSRPRTAGA